jgi:lipopolysaccharide transport system ATP-binding protein
MSDSAIEVRSLGKRYLKTVPNTSLMRMNFWRSLVMPFTLLRGKRKVQKVDSNTFWALKDVSFSVARGESLGIIGANGAGKSTLLKVLSRISPPTEGRVRIRGRVSSLLEVGTGFDRSLSGRDNVYLNASIMGLSRAEVSERFDEIVAFSGVGEFINMPVKYYSSGMYSRLAFSVAAHINPDILLVDEVLSVGDASFRQKSLGKMTELMKSKRTVVFVSHSMDSILQFCNKVLWLDHGRVVMVGSAEEVTRSYLDSVSKLQSSWRKNDVLPQTQPKQPNEEALLVDAPGAELLSFEILDEEGRTKGMFLRSEDIHVRIRYKIFNPRIPILPAFHLISAPRHHQTTEVHVFTSYDSECNFPRPEGEYVSTAVIPRHLLHSGKYNFWVSLVTPGGKLIRHVHLENLLSCLIVEGEDENRIFGTPIRGVIRPVLDWKTKLEEELVDRAILDRKRSG